MSREIDPVNPVVSTSEEIEATSGSTERRKFTSADVMLINEYAHHPIDTSLIRKLRGEEDLHSELSESRLSSDDADQRILGGSTDELTQSLSCERLDSDRPLNECMDGPNTGAESRSSSASYSGPDSRLSDARMIGRSTAEELELLQLEDDDYDHHSEASLFLMRNDLLFSTTNNSLLFSLGGNGLKSSGVTLSDQKMNGQEEQNHVRKSSSGSTNTTREDDLKSRETSRRAPKTGDDGMLASGHLVSCNELLSNTASSSSSYRIGSSTTGSDMNISFGITESKEEKEKTKQTLMRCIQEKDIPAKYHKITFGDDDEDFDYRSASFHAGHEAFDDLNHHKALTADVRNFNLIPSDSMNMNDGLEARNYDQNSRSKSLSGHHNGSNNNNNGIREENDLTSKRKFLDGIKDQSHDFIKSNAGNEEDVHVLPEESKGKIARNSNRTRGTNGETSANG